MASGYTGCKCRDCVELVVSGDTRRPEFCADCKEAGCARECLVPAEVEPLVGMRLRHLPVNNAWTWLFGDTPCRLDGEPLFFPTRALAVEAGARKGITP